VGVRDVTNPLMSATTLDGLGDDFGEERLRVRTECCRRTNRIVRGDECRFDSEASQRHLEQRSGAAVEIRRRHDVVACARERRKREEPRRLTTCSRDGTEATLQARHSLFERRARRLEMRL